MKQYGVVPPRCSVVARPADTPARAPAHLRALLQSGDFYYCYRPDGTTLDCIVSEITNTPWKERHSYVLDATTAQREGEVMRWDFAKAFHVSPFLPMRLDYAWRFTPPGARLHVHMDVTDGADKDFDATLVLERQPLTAATLARCLLRYPAMTLKVVARHTLAGVADVDGAQSSL